MKQLRAARHSKYSNALADRICKRIAEEGKTLREVAANEGISASLIIWWTHRHPEFAKQYARAVDLRTENDFEGLVELAFSEPERNEKGIDMAWVQMNRLRVDTVKWALSKRNPKKYGEKLQQELTGDLSLTLADTISKARKRLESGD